MEPDKFELQSLESEIEKLKELGAPKMLKITPNRPVFIVHAKTSFLYRLWYFLTNPFTYLIKGEIRY